MPDHAYYAAAMPCDEAMLPHLGRVVWAATRLHAGLREAVEGLAGADLAGPLPKTLGEAVGQLERCARSLAEPQRTRVLEWCRGVARPAVRARNHVLHAVAYTEADGQQAIMTNDGSAPGRYSTPELLRIAGQLEHAYSELAPLLSAAGRAAGTGTPGA